MKRSDRITAVVLTVAVALVVILTFLVHGTQGRTAVVRVDGQIVRTVDLASTSAESMTIEGVLGPVDIATDGRGSIRVTRARCPDQVCVHTAPAKSPGEQIICVPNHLVITIEGNRSDIDALAQ